METDRTWALRCGVIMPDHLHLLVTLGERLSLSRSVQRFKAKTSAALEERSALRWEAGYFDHRIHAGEEILPVFLYLHLNPYRAGLLTPDQQWPHFRCGAADWAWFRTQLDSDRPPPAWLA